MSSFLFRRGAMIAFTCLASCEQKEMTLSPEQKLEGRARVAVLDQLKDPTSAQFKDGLVSLKGHCILGKVLAKNGFGAFNGYERFVWDGMVYFESSANTFLYVREMTKCLDSMH